MAKTGSSHNNNFGVPPVSHRIFRQDVHGSQNPRHSWSGRPDLNRRPLPPQVEQDEVRGIWILLARAICPDFQGPIRWEVSDLASAFGFNGSYEELRPTGGTPGLGSGGPCDKTRSRR